MNTAVMRINEDRTVVWRKQSHEFKKRLCWLRAKLRRTVALWTALSDEVRACYGARDGGEMRRLEAQIEQHLSQADHERFWEGRVRWMI